MKDIRIQKLTLENFKCHKSLTIDFGGRETSIYGDNATGKSSIYDGLTWLLFGKDSRGSADAEAIKPLGADGQVADHQAVTAVAAEFLVDLGEVSEVTVLRRTLKEVWASKRGCPTPEYSGNVSEYAVNGVPMKKNGFDVAVKELVGEGLFRMLTSVKYFSADLKWQERRAVLFDMVGNLTDEQIMMQNEAFWELKDSCAGVGLESLKKKLTADRKRLVGAKNDGPARMSECQKLIDQLSGQDFAAAKAKALELDGIGNALREQMAKLKAGSKASEIGYALSAKRRSCGRWRPKTAPTGSSSGARTRRRRPSVGKRRRKRR